MSANVTERYAAGKVKTRGDVARSSALRLKAKRMKDRAERLRWARDHAGFATMADAARAYGWDEYVYRSHETGRRKFDEIWAQRYARAFRVRFLWLLSGQGTSLKGTLAVLSYVGAKAEVFPADGQIDEIEPPPDCPPDAFACIVRGDSMWPIFEDGDILVCVATEIENVMGRRAVVDLMDGRRMVKQVQPGSSPGLHNLVSHNAEPLFNVALTRCAKIIWHKPR
jgi:hypothetical protein